MYMIELKQRVKYTMTTNECPVCVEPFNATTRKRVVCFKCDYLCCATCFRRYISDIDSPHTLKCMSCAVEFDRTALYKSLGASFMATTFRDIRQHLLYEIERGFFPATQEIIEQQLVMERLRQQISTLASKYAAIRNQRVQDMLALRYSSEVMSAKQAIDRYAILVGQIDITNDQLYEEQAGLRSQIAALERGDGPPARARVYVAQCPHGDCKGTLTADGLSPEGHYICPICEGKTCRDCEMPVGESHQCDQGILETIKFMRASSKPCPSCGVRIHRISGCDQMFCTKCHASFDWRTMRLNNGAVHNPHHAEWMRQHHRDREVGDIRCGRELSVVIATSCYQAFRHCATHHLADKPHKLAAYIAKAERIAEIIRMAVHHRHVTLPALTTDQFGHHTNQRLRIQLLKGDIDEANFKRIIQQRDKANAKRMELSHIVVTFRDAATDIVWRIIDRVTAMSFADWNGLADELDQLVLYINQCFADVARVYHTIAHDILSDRYIR